MTQSGHRGSISCCSGEAGFGPLPKCSFEPIRCFVLRLSGSSMPERLTPIYEEKSYFVPAALSITVIVAVGVGA
jgi:hypothetical protein